MCADACLFPCVEVRSAQRSTPSPLDLLIIGRCQGTVFLFLAEPQLGSWNIILYPFIEPFIFFSATRSRNHPKRTTRNNSPTGTTALCQKIHYLFPIFDFAINKCHLFINQSHIVLQIKMNYVISIYVCVNVTDSLVSSALYRCVLCIVICNKLN